MTKMILGNIRILASGWLTQTKNLASTGYFVVTSVLQPIVFATIACLLFTSGGDAADRSYAVVGAGMLSIWTLTLVGSGQALTMLRTAGVLELLVGAPRSFGLVLAPMTLATASFGVYALGATLVWSRILFGVRVPIEHPIQLIVALVVAVGALGALGMIFAAFFIRFRYANAFTNILDYPVWLLSGFLVPADVLPGWISPVGWLLPTSWAVQAVRGALLGQEQAGEAVALCLLTGLCYLGIAILTIRRFETLARRDAALALS